MLLSSILLLVGVLSWVRIFVIVDLLLLDCLIRLIVWLDVSVKFMLLRVLIWLVLCMLYVFVM